MEALREAYVLACAGDLAMEELPGIAAAALVRGVDAPLLRELAGQPIVDTRDVRDLFLAAMDEIGMPPMERHDAIRELIRAWAARAVAGVLSVDDAATAISLHARGIGLDAYFADLEEIRAIEHLFDMMDEHSEDTPVIERQLAECVRAIHERLGGPRLLR